MRIRIRENKYSVAVKDFVAFSRLLRFLYPHYYQFEDGNIDDTRTDNSSSCT